MSYDTPPSVDKMAHFFSESSIAGQNVHETHAANKKFELYCVHIRAFFIVGHPPPLAHSLKYYHERRLKDKISGNWKVGMYSYNASLSSLCPTNGGI